MSAQLNQHLSVLADMAWGKVVVVGFLCAGVYYAGLYNDGSSLSSQLQNDKQTLSQAEALLDKTKQAFADADRFGEQVKEMASQFEQIKEFMPEKMSKVDLLGILSETAAKSGARLVKVEPKSEAERGPFYEIGRIGFELEGTFSELVSFLSFLSHSPKLLTFDRLEVERAGDAADPEQPTLKLQAIIASYKYSRPDTPPNAQPGANGQQAAAVPAGGVNASN